MAEIYLAVLLTCSNIMPSICHFILQSGEISSFTLLMWSYVTDTFGQPHCSSSCALSLLWNIQKFVFLI